MQAWQNTIFTFLTSLALTYAIFRYAIHENIVPKANFRRKEDRPVALLGGLGVYLSLWVGIFLTGMTEFIPNLLFALPVMVFGIWDDIFELSARYKIAGQILAVGLWMTFTPAQSLILFKLGCPSYVAIALSAFWVVGIMNAANMIDGMDGQASTFAVIAAGSMAAATSSPEVAIFLSLVSAAFFGFLIHNFAPSRIYLGDSGSQLIGLILGTTATTLPLQADPICQIFVPLFVFAFAEADCMLAIVRRLRAGSSPLKGDHDHLHHKLLKAGFSVRQSWGIVTFAIVFSAVTAWAFEKVRDPMALWIIGLECTFALFLLLTSLYTIDVLIGRKISKFGSGIIHQHFRVRTRLEADPNFFRAVVFDLQPYFQELQTRGVAEIDAFIRGFRLFTDENFAGDFQVCMWGSYSVVILEKQKEFDRAARKKIIAATFHLLEAHGLKKNDSEIPWGLKFYSSTSRNKATLLNSNLITFVNNARAA